MAKTWLHPSFLRVDGQASSHEPDRQTRVKGAAARDGGGAEQIMELAESLSTASKMTGLKKYSWESADSPLTRGMKQ